MDDDHLEALRRLGRTPPNPGGCPRPSGLREIYGDDVFPTETVVVFHRGGAETRAAVKVDDYRWRMTGRRRRRSWDGLLRAIGSGYQLSLIE